MEENSEVKADVKKTNYFWFKTAAVLEIILGALMCFFPLSVILGAMLIVSGSHLFSISGNSKQKINVSDTKDVAFNMSGLEKYFKYKTIVYSILMFSFAGTAILTILIFSALAGAFSGASYEFTSGLHNFWQF
ncbi:hypothetical protein JXL83_08225 [candidate division WOR-3 bacterium]|nr:hypothetical protein [candidate division WOR-3 bacterium]